MPPLRGTDGFPRGGPTGWSTIEGFRLNPSAHRIDRYDKVPLRRIRRLVLRTVWRLDTVWHQRPRAVAAADNSIRMEKPFGVRKS